MNTYVHTYVCMYVCRCGYVYMHTDKRTHTDLRKYINVHMYVHEELDQRLRISYFPAYFVTKGLNNRMPCPEEVA